MRVMVFTRNSFVRRHAAMAAAAAVLASCLAVPMPDGSAVLAQASITGLGDISGGAFSSRASDVSDDGSVVVGTGTPDPGPQFAFSMEAFRWSAATGMVGLGTLNPNSTGSRLSLGEAVSGDGNVTVGFTTAVSTYDAYRHTAAGGMVSLGQLPGGRRSEAHGISGDGLVIVGDAGGSNFDHGFRWTAAGGLVDIGALPGTATAIRGVSKDGAVTVGGGIDLQTSASQALRHTVAGGLVGLGDLPGGASDSFAYAANADGSVVVGHANSASGQEAFRWTQAGGMVGLGDLAGGDFRSLAHDVTDDGFTIVGAANDAGGPEAFYWTVDGGMQSLTALLNANGANLTASGWTELTEATGVTGDGKYVVGYGMHNGNTEAFLAYIPEPTSLGALGIAAAASLIRRRRPA